VDYPAGMLISILITLGIAISLHFVLWLIVKFFGQGGEGLLGDIRTAIGRALPLPLGIAIWIIAATNVLHKIVLFYSWQDMVSLQTGDVVLNLSNLISMIRTAILVLLATWFVARAVRSFADILNKWHSKKDGIDLDTTAIQALASISVILIWVLGIVVMLQALGMNMNALLAVGGIGGAAFAFASKDVIANFFGGLLIMFNRPFKVGDSIKSGSKIAGKVTRVGLYATWLETEEGESLYVPNSIFNNNEIKNCSESK
jgi:MscS family membrane protein